MVCGLAEGRLQGLLLCGVYWLDYLDAEPYEGQQTAVVAEAWSDGSAR